MKWNDVRLKYRDEWVIIEAISAHSVGNSRVIEQLTVVDTFNDDNNEAMLKYVELHKEHPERELYVVHTSREELNIRERRWMGVRRA